MVVTRYVSLSSMLAGVAMIVAAVYVFVARDGWACSLADSLVLGLLALICLLVIVKHRSNIARLMQGTEPKAFMKKD